MACAHERFMCFSMVNHIVGREGGPVLAYAADIQIRCADCDMPMRFVGLPFGVSQSQPTVSADGTELRVPMELATVPEMLGVPVGPVGRA